MMEAIYVWFASHPEVVTAIFSAALVHLRAVVPAGKTGTFLGFLTDVWDKLAGNYGHAANVPAQDKQDTPVKNALDV